MAMCEITYDECKFASVIVDLKLTKIWVNWRKNCKRLLRCLQYQSAIRESLL